MKTIGILTFHRSINCGSALLAYSLASFLNQAGFHAEVIDFIPHGYQKLYGLFHLPLSLSALKKDSLLLIPSILKYQLKRKKIYNDFVTKIIPLSKERKISASSLWKEFQKNCICRQSGETLSFKRPSKSGAYQKINCPIRSYFCPRAGFCKKTGIYLSGKSGYNH